MLTFQITEKDHCRRLESFLRNLLPASPFAYPRKLIKSGAVKLNDSTTTPDVFLAAGDSVTVKESSTLTTFLSPEPPSLDIIYEDDQIVVVNKPSGLPMHRTAESEQNLVDLGILFMLQRRTPCKLYPVNRLDRGTSGTVMMAKSSSSAGIFGRQVKETGLDKLYLALVEGHPQSGGVICEPLDDKESETRFEIMSAGSMYSLLSVIPISGRMHQIRRHLEMIGHPVVGDKRYGAAPVPDLPGFALHSFKTVLTLPDERTIGLCSPLPEELLRLCEQGGIDRKDLLEALYKMI